MLSKKQRKFFGVLVAIASVALIISSVGGSLFFLIGN
jgi:hypothetical protein